ncbi:MAG: DUF3347 domain-containing protein [Verrucomicrobia bacterium]|nr:DUF3347 domain-containing protein [Verrucomicrobiota bacterium]
MTRLSRLMLAAGFILGFVRLTAADSMNMSGDMKKEILSSYVKVSAALAADDLAAAKKAAADVAGHAKMSSGYKAIAPKADTVAKATKIDAAREAFKSLSAAVEPLAKGEKGYVVMNCPMASADWVQTSKDVKNPYYGKSMLSCGAPKEMK